MSPAAAGPAAPLRAAMFRQASRPKVKAARPATAKPVVRKARRVATSNAMHRPHRKRASGPIQEVAAAPPSPSPTPVAVAARAMARPAAFALISSTTCVTGGSEVGRLYSLRAPSFAATPEASSALPPTPDGPPGLTFIPESLPFGELGPGVETPILLPEVPLNPPTTPLPPLNPGAVPEPSTWVILIAGFGLLGAQFRRRRGASDLRAATCADALDVRRTRPVPNVRPRPAQARDGERGN